MKQHTSYKINLMPLIIEEAAKCFKKKGIKAVKMDDIARNLGISKRTMYELYSNKEDILIEVIKVRYQNRKDHIKQFSEDCDNVMDLLIEILGIQIETAANTNIEFYKDLQRYERATSLLAEYYQSEYDSAFEFFTQGVKEGFFIPNIDYNLFLKVTRSTIRMIRTNEEYSKMSYQELFINYLYPTIRGICTIKGLEKIDAFVSLEQESKQM